MILPSLGTMIRTIRDSWRRPEILLPPNTFLFGFFVGMMLALVPLYMYANGYDVSAIGAVVAAQAVFQIGLRVVAGVVADRYGEPRVITAGFVAMLISALLFMVSTNLWLMFLAQLFTGVSRAAHMPASKSYASRIHEENAAGNIGRTLGATTLGNVAGPVVGGLLSTAIGFSGAFAVAAAVATVGLIVSFLLPGLPRKQAPTMGEAFARVPAMIRSRATALPGLIALFVASSMSVMTSVFVVLLRDSDSGETTVGLILGAVAVGASAASFGFATIHQKLGTRGVFALLFGTIGAGMVAMALTDTVVLWLIFGGMVGAGVGLGAVMYGLLAAVNSEPQERGVAMSVAGLYWAGGMLVGPLTYGALAEAMGTSYAVITAGAFPVALALLTPIVFATLSPQPVPEPSVE
jgi:DHA1 family multidrug resistance protein-like MFS transporter